MLMKLNESHFDPCCIDYPGTVFPARVGYVNDTLLRDDDKTYYTFTNANVIK